MPLTGRILLVDDEQDIALILKRGLESHGFNVSAYTEPSRALSDYKPFYYDFYVFDIRMPGMTGFDLARQVWLQDPDAQVCFLSSFEIYEDEARKVFKDLNTKCFIKKPVTASRLAEHLKAHARIEQ